MTPDQMFETANQAALLGWAALLLLPRHRFVLGALRLGLITGLALLYAVLVLVYFFRVDGGGFGSIGEVRALFQSDQVLVAGWLHYLAFDLFVGVWIAESADRRGISRLIQAPILVATFMFGPLGLLLYTLTAIPFAAANRPLQTQVAS